MFSLFMFDSNTSNGLPCGVKYQAFQIYTISSSNAITVIKSRDNDSLSCAQRYINNVCMNRSRYTVITNFTSSEQILSSFRFNIESINRVDFYIEEANRFYKMKLDIVESNVGFNSIKPPANLADIYKMWLTEINRIKRVSIIDEVLNII